MSFTTTLFFVVLYKETINSTLDNNVVLVLIGFALTILGGIIGFFLKRWHIRYQIGFQIKVKAGTDFYMAFDREIGLLKTGITPDTWNPIEKRTAYDIIEKSAVKHDKAIRIFRRHLTKRRHIDAFDKAWAEYRCEEAQEAVNDLFICYKSNTGISDDEKAKRKLALENIDKLLEFINKL